jgi:hypothetical protein
MNNAGDVVGTVGFGLAFLLHDGQFIDLNTVLPAGSGWDLGAAFDINDHGQIVGTGTHDGAPRGFLMIPITQPVPAAPSIALLVAGVAFSVVASLRACRRR